MNETNFKEVLIFQISGKFAHFKKFYSNKSSLTYKIPPRTVLMGIIASILEETRDSYYEWLSPVNSKIGLRIIDSGYSHFECSNYLMSDGGHTQVRLELLIGRNKNIVYQVYFASNDINKFQKIEKRIREGNLGYGIYLGQRQFKANICFIEKLKISDIKQNHNCEIQTVANEEDVIELLENNEIIISMEKMPVSFQPNRIPVRAENFIFEETGKPLKTKLKKAFILENGETITFL